MYDPMERVVAVLRQDHAVENTVLGPWSHSLYDANGNVLLHDPKSDPDVGHHFALIPEEDYLPSWYGKIIQEASARPEEREAATRAAAHSNTPKLSYIDPMRSTFLVIVHNGSEKLSTSMAMVIQGNVCMTRDALGRIASVGEWT